MITARLHAARDLRVAQEPDPDEPSAGHTLVRVTSVGLCGSDLHWWADGGIGDAVITRPIVPGHEFGGVALSGTLAGRRVAVDPAIPCEHCEMCRRGYFNLCPNVRFAGHGANDGGLQELLSWPSDLLHAVPDDLSDDAVALLEPLGVAVHTIDLSHLQLGDDVVVVGAGPIGLLCMELALRRGARRVFAVDPLAHRRQAAAARGAIVAEPNTAAEAIAAQTDGRGVDVAVEVAGVDAGIDLAVAAVRPGARVVLAGIPSGERSSFVAGAARRKGLTFSMVRRMNEVYPRAIALATDGGIDLDALVSDHFPLADVDTAFAFADGRTGLKTVVSVGSS